MSTCVVQVSPPNGNHNYLTHSLFRKLNFFKGIEQISLEYINQVRAFTVCHLFSLSMEVES